jgi:hypothetical protein
VATPEVLTHDLLAATALRELLAIGAGAPTLGLRPFTTVVIEVNHRDVITLLHQC